MLRLKVEAEADSKSVIPVLAELVHFPSYFHRFLYTRKQIDVHYINGLFLPQISAYWRR